MTLFSPPRDPSYTSNVNKEYRTLVTDFGDGYKARTVDGINNVREVWELSWDYLNQSDADAIVTALDGFAGTSFEWVTPDTLTKKFTCSKLTKTFTSFESYSIRATFTQSFN